MKLKITFILIITIAACIHFFSSAAAQEPAPTAEKPSLPKNQWIPISNKVRPVKRWCSTWYMPATDEFFHWGRSVGNYYGYTRRYDVETLSLADAEPRWTESLPKGKEKTWARLKFPDWARNRKNRMNWKPIKGPREGNQDPGFMMSWVKTEGILRPNRCPIFHQATWDSKRKKLFFFVGGKTFTYDPVERIWADLKTPTPPGLHCLAWHTMCYDPVGDKVVLFGGGAAMNLWGGAKTLVYNFDNNAWERPELADGIEPELRCNARLVYDTKNEVMVMFGGNAMDRTLNDTWVFDPAKNAWKERTPKICPPVSEYYAACYVEPAGQVFLCTARRGSSRSRRWRGGEPWAYDAAKNTWTPLKGRLPDKDMEWLSCDYAPKHNAIVMAIPNFGTFVYRPDPATWADANPKRRKGRPGQEGWFYNGQRASILKAPPGDREKHEAWLKNIPENTVVDPKYPETIYHRAWGSATIDTDRGIVLYSGGGHSTYKGNEIVQYDIGPNRWAMDSPPCMMPFEWRHGAAIYGWRYRLRPSDQHTYRWYAYDPDSKLLVYCARPAGPHSGQTVLLDEDTSKAFVYNKKKHGHWTFVYDPKTRKWFKPVFGRPFANPCQMGLIGTPKGVFAQTHKHGFWRIEVLKKGDEVDLKFHKLSNKGFSGGGGGNWEFQPLVYDSRRNRLLQLCGGRPVKVYEWSLTGGPWKKLKTSGPTESSREVIYDIENDCLLALGEARLYAMDCGTNTWQQIEVSFPKARRGSYGINCAMVYDPVHKVTAMLIRSKLHLFRYNPETAEYHKRRKAAPEAGKAK